MIAISESAAPTYSKYATGPEGKGPPKSPVGHISQPFVDISRTLSSELWVQNSGECDMALDTTFMQLNPTLTSQVACFLTWIGYSNCKAEVQDETPPCTVSAQQRTGLVLTFLQVSDTIEVDWLVWDYKVGQSYHQTSEQQCSCPDHATCPKWVVKAAHRKQEGRKQE